ncbi:MAG: metallophosphoesterase [Oscillospiraceae bacterium]|nr:metallophosphoesterase [Oscillospiraceae bacterium]
MNILMEAAMNKARFAVISDTHYFSPRLTDGKRAYELRSDSDQKCLLESGAIIDSAFKTLALDETIDSVLICGDLTCDGETVGHEEFIEKLDFLRQYKKVYVITSTHDWASDENARKFFGDNEQVIDDVASKEELTKLYSRFGPDEAIAKYEIENGLCSYVVQLCDGFRLFALNDDQNGAGCSGYDENHMKWIVSQLNEAKKTGNRVIAMQHHVVLQHYTPLLTKGGLCCADRESVAEKFADNGVELLFVGHSHMHNITEYRSTAGNKLVQVNVGSLIGYPAPIVKVNIDDEYTSVHTEYVKKFTYCGREYKLDYLLDHTRGVLEKVINSAASGDKKDFTERCAALGLHSKAVEKLYFAIRRLAAYIKRVTVGEFAGLVNRLTFGKGINKQAANEAAEKTVIGLVYDIFLNLFDGCSRRYKKGTPIYTVVTDFVSIPSRALRHIPFAPQKIQAVLDEITELVGLLMDDAYDNNYFRYKNEDEKLLDFCRKR